MSKSGKKSHHNSYVSLHYLVKYQTSHSSRRQHWPIAWSTLIETEMWPPNSQDSNPIDYAVWGRPFSIWFIKVDNSRHSTTWSRRSSRSAANCRSVWLIALLVSGVAGLSASSSSKTDTLNIWCENCKMWQLLYTISETINRLFLVVNFLQCVVTDIVLF